MQIITIVLTAVIASIGVAGVPSSAVITLAMVLQAVGVGCKFSVKLPRKRKLLAAQGEYGKIIDVARRKLCLLTV